MSDDDKRQLYQAVLAGLARHTPRLARRRVEAAIYQAHNGRPDGYLVTSDNMWLFRQYRNSVSPDPARLVDEALDWSDSLEEAKR